MNPVKSVKAPWRWLLVAVPVVILSGCAAPTIAADPGDASTSAMTAEDHAELAALLGRESSLARQQAARHREMGNEALTRPAGGRGAGSLSAHCRALVLSFDEQATQLGVRAAAHRLLAQRASP